MFVGSGLGQPVGAMRLQITAEPATLRPGDPARIDVEFLGREYQKVANDIGADEEQDERVADGGGRRVQQAAITREEVFHGIAGQPGPSAGIGE
jgi:hypothetical protein